jgi:hypothetical protein
MEKIKDVWTSLICSYEIFASYRNLVLIVWTHFLPHFIPLRDIAFLNGVISDVNALEGSSCAIRCGKPRGSLLGHPTRHVCPKIATLRNATALT